MFGQAKLADLQIRKQMLLIQADAQRRLLVVDAKSVATSLHWVETVHRVWQQIKPLALMAAPVAGFFVARRGRSLWQWGSRAFGIWGWVRPFLSGRR